MSSPLSRAKTHFLFPQAEYCYFDMLFFNILTTKTRYVRVPLVTLVVAKSSA